MAYEPEEYLKEAIRNLEKFKDALIERNKDLERRIEKLEQK